MLTSVQTGPHSAGICTVGRRCLGDEAVSDATHENDGQTGGSEGVGVVPASASWRLSGSAGRWPSGRGCASLYAAATGAGELTGTHVPGDMLGAGEGRVAYGTLEAVSGERGAGAG